MRFFLETYGCQMNFAESISLKSRLENSGWEESNSFEDSDIVIINTCAVRQTAENRVWGRLGFFGRQKKEFHFRIALLGCMSERIRDTIHRKAPFVDYVVGVSERFDFIEFLCGAKGELDGDFHGTRSEGFLFDDVYGDTSDVKAFVPIMHGCNNFCTYCIVPYVRGPGGVERSGRYIRRMPETLPCRGRGTHPSGAERQFVPCRFRRKDNAVPGAPRTHHREDPVSLDQIHQFPSEGFFHLNSSGS